MILISTKSTPVNFTIEAPVAGFYYSGVASNDGTTINLPFDLAVFSSHRQYKGIYIRADSDELTVVGQNEKNGISDTFLVTHYEQSSTNTEYVYYGISVRGYSSSYQGAILIVGTENNTTMKLRVTQTATTNYGHTYYTGREYSFVINRLQTFYIRSSSYTSDLTGTTIVTDKQVSVFSGHESTRIPYNLCCEDTIIEQIPPVTSWGRVFYTMPFVNRKNYEIRILASQNMTKVDLYCNNFYEFSSINEGQYYSKISQEYCVIRSDKPVLVAQFSRGGYDERDYFGDPMMMIISDTLQFSHKVPITTMHNPSRSDYKHYINIMVLAQYYQPDMIHLISGGSNVSLNTQRWVPIKVKHAIEAYATQVTLTEGVAEVIHDNTEALLMLNVYGISYYGSYGHPGRLGHLTGLCS